MFFFLKALVCIGTGMVGCVVILLLASGIKNWPSRSEPRPEKISGNVHKKLSRLLIAATAIIIIPVRMMVVINNGIYAMDGIFKFHLACAITFALTLMALLRITGRKNKYLHAAIAGVLTIACAGMIVTAIPLLLRLHRV